jgi:2-methylcitrate dehydratase PrpD
VFQWGNGNSTIIGCQHKTAAPWAALVNENSAHAIDFDDYNETPSFTHPSSTLLPALLAIAEEQDKPGSDVLDAFIVGVKVMPKYKFMLCLTISKIFFIQYLYINERR